jgi:uncharacterized membrane protein YgcG
MRFGFILVLGLVFAAGLGLAAHVIARDTVALPVASIQAGERLAPVTTRRSTATKRVRTTTTARTKTATTTTRTETDDDHGRGRGRNRGRGGSGSGGGDDD